MADNSYRDRVQAMCDVLKIGNQIREDDLTVEAVSFCIDGQWRRIDGTDMNLGGRAFFQYNVERHAHMPDTTVTAPQHLKERGEGHFGEMWHDAEEKGRSLIMTFKAAGAVRVHWKPQNPE
tara:strand:- start:6910 stop:7272 length:363 start_codon:yes stop_codon:yes gene_type:complete